MRSVPRSWQWLAMVAVLGVALVVGSSSGGGPDTVDARVERITGEVRCPTCRGQSVADSDSPAAVDIRQEVRRQVEAGRSDADIMDFLVERFTEDIRLSPRAEGVGLVVWLLPTVGLTVVVTVLAVVFIRRTRTRVEVEVTDSDRDLVSRAMAGGNGHRDGPPAGGDDG